VILAILPGMPFLPFILLAGCVGGGAFVIQKRKGTDAASAEAAKQATAPVAEDDPAHMLAIDDLRIELGYGLLPLIHNESGPRLTDQVRAVRRSIAQELGFVTPPVRILDNMQLAPNEYVIRLKEQEVARGKVRPGQFMVMDPGGARIDLAGEPAKEPAFGLDAMWIDESQRETASLRGLTVVDAATVLTTHLTEIIKGEAPELLSYAETKKLLDGLPSKHRNLVNDLIPSIASVTTVQRVLQALLAEKVSIRDLPSVLEAIAEAAPQSQNTSTLTEHVRARLARQICGALKSHDGATPIVTLSANWENEFADALMGEREDRQLAMAPSKLQEFVKSAMAALEQAAIAGHSAAIVTSAGVRPFVRSVIERVRPQTVVLSQNEIHPHTKLNNLGSI
jgi:flagellar biosynthesis protein FlhA